MAKGAINLHVLLDETLRGISPEALVVELRKNYPVRTAVLERGRSFAINYTNTPVTEGMNEANLKDFEIIGPIYGSFTDRLLPVAPLSFHFPAEKYNCCAWLPDREVRGDPMFFTRQPRLPEGSDVVMEFIPRHGPQAPVMTDRLAAILDEWRGDCLTTTYDDERLVADTFRVRIREGKLDVPIAAQAATLTLPWLDLCLRVRRDRRLRSNLREVHFRAAAGDGDKV